VDASAGDVNNSTGAVLYKNRFASQLGNSGAEKKSLPMGLLLSVFDLKPKARCVKTALVMIAGFSP
jgi:hypothetical protein